MDRDDARFVVNALDSRVRADRESLDQLAVSSADRLKATAAGVRALAADWPPALIAACELESIGQHGAATLERPRSIENLIIFVDKLAELVLEPARAVPRNRKERRALAKVAN